MAVLVAALVGSCSAEDSEPATPAVVVGESALEWRDCGRLECSSLEVPVDHGEPEGATIDIAIARLAATGDERVGSLLVNPGGPGGSGIDYLQWAGGTFAELRRSFDIVAFDPRGVGSSSPIDCLSDAELDEFLALDRSPDDDVEREHLLDMSERLAEGCRRRSPELVDHVSTAAVVRDLDLLRDALGDEQLNYLGFSYGTYIGTRYIEMFGDRVRALVLDGAVDPALDPNRIAREQAQGFADALDGFFGYCRDDPRCSFGAPDPAGAFDALMGSLEQRPLEAADGRELGPGLAELGVLAATYDDGAWPALAEALSRAELGDPSGLLALADLYTERESGTYQSNLWEALFAVNCLDGGPVTVSELEELAGELSDVRLGEAAAWLGAPCVFWSRTESDLGAPLEVDDASEVLVIGTTGDPATPVGWARSLHAGLPGSGLLVFEGGGHTAFGRSECVDRAVVEFLTSDPPVAAELSGTC